MRASDWHRVIYLCPSLKYLSSTYDPARAVRSQKTLRVLHAAWGPLMEARLAVAKPRHGGGGDDVVGLMLTLTLHAL